MRINHSWLSVFLLLFLSGCLPYSCTRTETRVLMAADSLSRAIAETFPVDTLRQVWVGMGPEAGAMAYPRTVRFGHDGRIYVSDTERNSLFVFAEDGAFVEEITDEAFAFPYLAGVRGDTLLVFSPEARRVDFVAERRIVGSVPTPEDLPARGALQYAAADAKALYFKALGEGFSGYLARLDDEGTITARHTLDGPAWRYAGLLRPWGDTLLSLSGFRPVLDQLPADFSAPPDSLVLSGFDSPMLARSRLFLIGETHQPPLLSAAAAPTDTLLFVLNMRPGWLHIDAFDRQGHLRLKLTQENPAFNQDYYPTDLDARQSADGHFEIAVVTTKPIPQLTLYRF